MSADPSGVLMRGPCRCGETRGVASYQNGQDVVRCVNGHFCYNRPKAESGTPTRSTRSRPNLKPSARYEVLARDAFKCVLCGRDGDSSILHVDHMIPMNAAEEDKELRAMLNSEENLVTLCEECNLGKSNVEPRLRELAILLIRLHRASILRKAESLL